MIEIVSAQQWLYSVLAGDSTLMTLAPGGVWDAVADPNTATPYIIISSQDSRDSVTMQGVRLMTRGLFQVKAVGPASSDMDVANAATRFDTLLSPGLLRPPIETSNTIVYTSYRESALKYNEQLPNGEPWINIGGLYRVYNRQK